MFRILIVDDSMDDRDILKLEIIKALSGRESDLRFYEAQSIKRAKELLKTQSFDLMTLDIEFDRLNEGIDNLPEFFEDYPALNIMVISGKLNKAEVTERLFRFTRENVLKGKRWARHFDVLDKKDEKTEAIEHAYNFALKQRDVSSELKYLFLLAESYLQKDELDKCLDVYKKIQNLEPGEGESAENIGIFEGNNAAGQSIEYLRQGRTVVASLLLGHHLEVRLKLYTKKIIGHSYPSLHDCIKELDKSRKISQYKKSLFHQLLKVRNKAIHHPGELIEKDFTLALENLKLLEAKF